MDLLRQRIPLVVIAVVALTLGFVFPIVYAGVGASVHLSATTTSSVHLSARITLSYRFCNPAG